jgi:RNA polymerase-binding transcription factor DksA
MKTKSLRPPHPTTPDPAAGIPAPWRWHARTLQRLHDRLQGRADRHLAAAGARPADEPEFAARASEESEFEMLIAQAKAETGLLAEVEAALDRLHAGSYGICAVTHQPIPADRLRALPWTRFSVEAAAQLAGNTFYAGPVGD